MGPVVGLLLGLALHAHAARAQLVTPPTREESPLFALRVPVMDRLPPLGKLEEWSEFKDLALWSGWLENGVRVRSRFMYVDGQKAQVHISLHGGALREDPSARGLTQAAIASCLTHWNTRTHPHARFKEMLKGRQVGIMAFSRGDAVTIVLNGTPLELEAGLQVAHLLLTQPVVDPVALEQWKAQELRRMERERSSTQRYFDQLVVDALFPKDEIRPRALTREEVLAITPDKVQAWVDKLVRHSPIEACVVGQMHMIDARDAMARYLGSLPPRERITPDTLAPLRVLPGPSEPIRVELAMESSVPRAVVGLGHFAPDGVELERVRILSVATRILTNRLRALRKEDASLQSRGAAAQLNPGGIFPGYGLLLSVMTVPGEQTDAALARLRAAMDDLAAQGPTPGELEEARKTLADDWLKGITDAGVWAQVLESATATGIDIPQWALWYQQVQKVTAEQVREELAKVLQTPSVTVVAKPLPKVPNTGGQVPNTPSEPAQGGAPR
jgi:predicted Zn-dependent peptidase